MAAKKLYATATGMTGILSVNINQAHNSTTAAAQITCLGCSITIGDYIEIYLGYTDDYVKIFTGYVKIIERTVPENTYHIVAQDVLIRAVDFFIATTDPDAPYKWDHISGENLVRNVLALAGLNDYDPQATSFTFGINTEVEVNLVSAYDFCNKVCNILAWNLWAENDTVYFKNRKPYVMTGDSGQPGDVADIPIGVIVNDNKLTSNLISFQYSLDETDLRNRIVVYGTPGIHAEASAASPYLPDGFYKTAAVGSPIIDQQSMADASAAYNLALYNHINRRVRLSMIGNPHLLPRRVLTFNEEYTGINKNMYIYLCEHNWSKEGYTTTLELRGIWD